MNEAINPAEPTTEFRLLDLVKAYRMYQQMMRYPHLVDEMRGLFLSALEEAGIGGRAMIEEAVRRFLAKKEEPFSEGDIPDFTGTFIDLYFAHHFSDEQIQNYIHLARKKDAFRRLNQILNMEGVTSGRIKKALKEFCAIPQGNLRISPDEAEGVRVSLINHFVSNQLAFIGIAKQYITIRDIDELLEHSYWNRRRSGRIGGKAAGMFLAGKILLPRFEERDPEIEKYLAIPESYYFNSGILSDFIDYNHLYSFHSQKYKSREAIEEEYENMEELLRRASFPPDVIEDFSVFLEKIGEHPLILRSSSLLEDNFGFTFSGKYESFFLANQGALQKRLNDFMWGMKQILKSTFSPAAILYRRDHNLLDFDERMSVLVQKVVGHRCGPYFLPFAAGVAFSQNMYTWSPVIRKEDGMVRLVLGLGTRAVDRTGPGYPLIVPLSHPLLRPEVSAERIKKYSQKMVDVIHMETGRFESVSYFDILEALDGSDLFHAVSVDQEGHLSPPLFKGQKIDKAQSCITFINFLSKTPFAALMKKILKRLQEAYGYPVDVEFAWDDEKLYLLQCRPLAIREHMASVIFPDHIPGERILFTNDRDLTHSSVKDIEYIVYVNPKGYARLSTFEERMAVARTVGKLNHLLEGKRYVLLGPARWGTTDINLGVKVSYADINHTLILGEIAFEEDGLIPEVSYGTHFYSDLVEARIIPLAIYPDQTGMVFNEAFLTDSPNILPELAPDLAPRAQVVRVLHVPSCTGGLFLQVLQDAENRKGVGFFAPAENRGKQV